jgi:hypothetical protein
MWCDNAHGSGLINGVMLQGVTAHEVLVGALVKHTTTQDRGLSYPMPAADSRDMGKFSWAKLVHHSPPLRPLPIPPTLSPWKIWQYGSDN